jgi:TRAP-type C4-dicarboxylate transport system substrate-binding protein
MKNKRLATVLLLTLALISSGSSAQEPAKTYKWDFFLGVPTNHPRNVGLIKMVASLKEKTGGKLDITLRAAGEVPYKGPESVSVVASGAMQMSDANPGQIAGDSQVGAMPTYPFLVPNWESFRSVMNVLTPAFSKEMADRGIKTLFFFPDPEQYVFGSGKAIEKLSDFKGRKIRVHNSYVQEFVRSVGASGIAITSNEIPDAIGRSLINTFITSSVSTQAGKLYEFIDWTLKIPFSAAGSWVIVNKKAWDSLPPEFQTLIEKETVAMEKIYWDEIVPAQNAAALKEIREYKNGKVKIYENIPAIGKEGRALIEGSWSKWAKESGPYSEMAIKDVLKVLGK